MTVKDEASLIHDIICNTPILHDADGGNVSRKWVASRESIVIYEKSQIKGFVLYDLRDKDNCVYIDMIWIDPKFRRKGIAETIVSKLMKSFSARTILAYANPDGQRLLRKCGLNVGKTAYRECILHPK